MADAVVVGGQFVPRRIEQPEIGIKITGVVVHVEAHRLAGDMDYILKVQVASTRDYDDFYKRLIARVTMHSVTAFLSMETLKYETAIPL